MNSCAPAFSAALLHPRYWLSWLSLLLVFLVSLLPLAGRHWLGRLFGRILYRYNPKRRLIIAANLRQVFPEDSDQQIKQRVRRCLQWYGCGLVEYSMLFFASRSRLQQLVELRNPALLRQAVADGQNVMILLLHSCTLDLAPVALMDDFRLYGSYKPLKNAVLDWWMARARCRNVDFVVARDEGMLRLVRSMEPGQLLIFLPDEDLGPRHADFASFFGRPKATLNTPARIARLKKAKAFPCYVWFDPEAGRYQVELFPAIEAFGTDDAGSDAVKLNQALEEAVRRSPEQYMWMLKLFRTAENGPSGFYNRAE